MRMQWAWARAWARACMGAGMGVACLFCIDRPVPTGRQYYSGARASREVQRLFCVFAIVCFCYRVYSHLLLLTSWLWLFQTRFRLLLHLHCGLEVLLLEDYILSPPLNPRVNLWSVHCELRVPRVSAHYLEHTTIHRYLCSCRRPMVTGTSVLGVTFQGGVMLAADTLGQLVIHHKWVWKNTIFLSSGRVIRLFSKIQECFSSAKTDRQHSYCSNWRLCRLPTAR